MVSSEGSERMLAGRYRLGERLGRGGMAEVWAADDLRLARPVAVKILRAEFATDPVVRQRFESEAKTSARLSHPNVVGVFDADEEGDTAYIVMERLPGRTLGDDLESGPLSIERCRSVLAQVLGAVGAAHQAGIVHRDIKPGNVLTCPDGTVKVGDFGIATVAGAASTITAAGLVVGTPAYLAPERVAGEAATFRSDLYSVGALLYHCLSGRRPYEGCSGLSALEVVRERPPIPLTELAPAAPADLIEVVERAMARDPRARFASAEEMAAAASADRPSSLASTQAMLRPAGGESTPTAVVPVTRPGPTSVLPSAGPAATSVLPAFSVPWAAGRGRRAAQLWATAALALLLVVVVALALSQGGSPPTAGHGAGGASVTSTSAPASTTTSSPPPPPKHGGPGHRPKG